ncbi:hypothetical protein DIZ48_09510 [Legionella pneumophila]|nr:hypothetical protein D7214_06275 [Legionella pneumophila]TIE23813.1 hypothetical protein DIZ73_17555 [Legionella pneumophila]TIE26627.1 hypothetical protein DIZ48_09510 [Legionella pneumophila]TIE48147.1 hypothetical protein DIZ50_09065 [Legionella pneumophila]
MDYFKNFESATRSDIDKLLLGKLSDALNENQKQKISNLLNDMRNKEIIQNVDSRKLSIWRLQRTSVGRALNQCYSPN